MGTVKHENVYSTGLAKKNAWRIFFVISVPFGRYHDIYCRLSGPFYVKAESFYTV
jgi:hypothetical protein